MPIEMEPPDDADMPIALPPPPPQPPMPGAGPAQPGAMAAEPGAMAAQPGVMPGGPEQPPMPPGPPPGPEPGMPPAPPPGGPPPGAPPGLNGGGEELPGLMALLSGGAPPSMPPGMEMMPQEQTIHTVKVRRTKKVGQLKIAAVPPEEFIINIQAKRHRRRARHGHRMTEDCARS